MSESGSASVIEVIEPTSSEEEEFERSLRQLNLGWNLESGWIIDQNFLEFFQ